MSGYLTITAHLKKNSKIKIEIASFSRNSDIYTAFNDSGIRYAYPDGKTPPSEMKEEDFDQVLDDLKESIENSRKRLSDYEIYVKDKPEYVEDITELKEYIEEQVRTESSIQILKEILYDEYNDLKNIEASMS